MPEPPGSFFNENDGPNSGGAANSEQSDAGAKGIPTIKPLEFAFSGTEQPATPRIKRKYTRRASGGSTEAGGETQKTVPNITASIEEAIWTACLMGANMAHAPEFEITHEEAKQIDVAVKNLSKFYNQTFDPKHIAWFQLCTVLGGTFYPRTISYRDRKKREAKPNVTPINRAPQQAAAPQQKVNGAPAPQQANPTVTADGKPDLSPTGIFGFDPPRNDDGGI